MDTIEVKAKLAKINATHAKSGTIIQIVLESRDVAQAGQLLEYLDQRFVLAFTPLQMRLFEQSGNGQMKEPAEETPTEQCQRCKGKGSIEAAHAWDAEGNTTESTMVRCTDCDGTGKVQVKTGECWVCGGRGYFVVGADEEEPCEKCAGTGRVTEVEDTEASEEEQPADEAQEQVTA